MHDDGELAVDGCSASTGSTRAFREVVKREGEPRQKKTKAECDKKRPGSRQCSANGALRSERFYLSECTHVVKACCKSFDIRYRRVGRAGCMSAGEAWGRVIDKGLRESRKPPDVRPGDGEGVKKCECSDAARRGWCLERRMRANRVQHQVGEDWRWLRMVCEGTWRFSGCARASSLIDDGEW